MRPLLALALLSCSDPWSGGRDYPKPGEHGDSGPQSDTASDPGADSDTDGDTDGDNDTGTGTDTDSDTDEPIQLTYPDQRVGIFYLAWHTYAAQAFAQVDASDRLTGEDVISSADLGFHDMITDRGLYSEAKAFHYHAEPELGFYCLYRARDGEEGPLPDCDEATGISISEVAATHAEQLWDAGVDFVFMDLTNLPGQSEFADVLGVRPLEVLIEEWADLRASGTPTPQVAAWMPVTAETGSAEPLYPIVLDVYAEHSDTDVVLNHDGQPVLFVVDHGGFPIDDSYIAEIEAAGVLPVPLWGNLGDDDLAGGTAGWMQPCRDDGSFTTLIDPDTPCDQGYTTTSPLGTVVSVSHSYQVGYASLPYQAVGRRDGLTFQLQMDTALSVQPDYLLINAWNEWIAQPQSNPYAESLGNLRKSMGEGHVDEGEDGHDWLWVDMYGVEYNRDLEPSLEGGDGPYQLMESCLAVYHSGATACSDSSEPCCQRDDDLVLVHSMRVPGGDGTDTDHLMTKDDHEIDVLTAAGSYEEVCNPHYAPPGLCSGGTTADGPFHLFASDGSDRQALYRCFTGNDHFFSHDSACEGTTVEHLLGYVSTVRTSATPRPLSRCYNRDAVVHFHWLDESCPDGVNDEGVLGFVR